MAEVNNNLTPIPPLPEAIPASNKVTKAIKAATPDVVLFNEDAVPVDVMSSLIFESIGGQEIINISRNDIINGKNVIYKTISNLQEIDNSYSSKNIINMDGTLDQYFKNFAIRLETHIPEDGTGPNGETVYIDEENKLVIDLVSMEKNEQVEIQILDFGIFLNDIIYYSEEV